MASSEVNVRVDVYGMPPTVSQVSVEKFNFKYLPAYAQFLLDNKLEEFASKMLQLSREVSLPLLKLFQSYTEKQLIELGVYSAKESLTFLGVNKGKELIEHSVRMWQNNEIPMISRDAIVADDITLVSFIRRKAFRDFLPFYTNEFATYGNIMEEVDHFTTKLETVSLNLLLNRQQSLYKQAQSLAHIGNWVWDLQANKLIWSEELYKIYEIEPGTELTREIIASYNHPDDYAYVLKQMQSSAETHKPHDFSYRIILKDGREKILHAKGQLVVDADNNPVQFFGTLQDVTEQKHFEKELTEKQNFIEKINNVTPSLVTIYNVQTGKYIFVNNALKKLLGYEPREALEKGIDFFMPLIHPDDFHSLMKENAKALELANRPKHIDDNEVIAEFQYRLLHKNGEYRWLHTYGTIFSRDSNKRIEFVLNISVDVTQQHFLNNQLEEEKISAQKNAEELRRSEERYHRMIAEVQDYAILMLDKDGTIQNWNLGAEKIKGYKAGEIIGKNFRAFYTDEDRQNHRPERLLKEAIETGKANDEGWRVRKDGSRFWGSIVITALHDENNNVIGFSKVTRDLTERKNAEERLKKYAEELEQRNEELTKTNSELESFNYVAGHDLQEPLHKIQIYSDAIQLNDFENLSETGKKYLNKIFNAANHMQQLIEDLLAFSRATSPNAEFKYTDLNILFNEVLSTIHVAIEESDAVIESESLPFAHIIPFQFRQALQNLISNSIKYTKPGKAPHIKISSKEFITKNNSRELRPNYKYLVITISDKGIGFDPQYAEKIFELFQRLHTKDNYPGTGIGLAIVKKIIQNHHGLIKAKGYPGKGATFEIYIPQVTE